MNTEGIHALVDILEDARGQRTPVAKLTDARPDLNIEDAYRIQTALRVRAQARGERVVGFKMGLTSFAKMRQMGVDTPIYGFLSDRHAVAEGGLVDAGALIHPKVEAELAFVMAHELAGPDCRRQDVLAATLCVCPAIELIDSRYRDFRFDLPSVIADNTSAAHFAIGTHPVHAEGVDLETLGVVLEINGTAVETGAGAAALDNPLNAIAMLANMLASRGERIPAGSILLSGAITPAVAVSAGDRITVRAGAMGSVTFGLC